MTNSIQSDNHLGMDHSRLCSRWAMWEKLYIGPKLLIVQRVLQFLLPCMLAFISLPACFSPSCFSFLSAREELDGGMMSEINHRHCSRKCKITKYGPTYNLDVNYLPVCASQGGRCWGTAGPAVQERSGSSTKGKTPYLRYFVAKLSIVAIYTFFERIS